MTVAVRAEVIGAKFHRLLIFIDQVPIGEYERAQAADIDRKTEEVVAAEAELRSLYEQHGELVVRWDRKAREKVIGRLDGVRVGSIPKHAWRTPSWIS